MTRPPYAVDETQAGAIAGQDRSKQLQGRTNLFGLIATQDFEASSDGVMVAAPRNDLIAATGVGPRGTRRWDNLSGKDNSTVDADYVSPFWWAAAVNDSGGPGEVGMVTRDLVPVNRYAPLVAQVRARISGGAGAAMCGIELYDLDDDDAPICIVRGTPSALSVVADEILTVTALPVDYGSVTHARVTIESLSTIPDGEAVLVRDPQLDALGTTVASRLHVGEPNEPRLRLHDDTIETRAEWDGVSTAPQNKAMRVNPSGGAIIAASGWIPGVRGLSYSPGGPTVPDYTDKDGPPLQVIAGRRSVTFAAGVGAFTYGTLSFDSAALLCVVTPEINGTSVYAIHATPDLTDCDLYCWNVRTATALTGTIEINFIAYGW